MSDTGTDIIDAVDPDDQPDLPQGAGVPDKPTGLEPLDALRAEQADPADVPTPPAAPAEDVRVAELRAWEAAGGQTIDVRGTKFRVDTDLPAMTVLDMSIAADPDAQPMEQMRAVQSFLRGAIHEDDELAWDRFLRRSRPRIHGDELNTIVERLMALVTGRPT